MHSSERVLCNIVLRKWAVVFHPFIENHNNHFPYIFFLSLPSSLPFFS
ncbi:hypothetical protein PHAVU_005G165400 [Phaseolus vulgaris]|uniref:Uncharacterized protein n=1 Tax=Phaseolus vulgaris TaxID=3885 RepID=V7BZR3_PHAVU|nr:hypothetical protein PHAVU_005G165400g [Phaseolus vulgaris]ESW22588.1 hypothetical protein PHAVU_005G165400g [Phaseolus vulgaris]